MEGERCCGRAGSGRGRKAGQAGVLPSGSSQISMSILANGGPEAPARGHAQQCQSFSLSLEQKEAGKRYQERKKERKKDIETDRKEHDTHFGRDSARRSNDANGSRYSLAFEASCPSWLLRQACSRPHPQAPAEHHLFRGSGTAK